VVALVVRAGIGWSLVGVAGGFAGALGLSRLISGLLFGVTPNDPATFVAIALAMLGVALAATYIPARRAASVDPITALRTE
jgi:ABC-type antimicrobial peptide transport system permease subunit